VTGRSPESISRWLDEFLYKFDGPGQYLGTEPNAARRPWDVAKVRWLLAASWDYSQAAGNMAIPAVYDAIHKAETYCLADRWYLPMTPRDMDLLEKAQVPVFGIESRHQLADFDVVATSISYTVLFMNFCKALSMSGIPLRWKDRAGDPGAYPMVMAGGQAYCAPEFMAPVVDCVWLGEAEDEPGNPGIAAVCEAIAQMKADGLWREERAMCYRMLAREFNFLYFPRFTAVDYRYEDRGLPEPAKMVSGYRSLLPGLGTTFKVRRVASLANADLMTSAPVLFADPGMGSDDSEVARGCPAWCSFCRLSWVTKPYRQEPVERSLARAKLWRDNMGSTGISLVAPDPPMHSQMKRLVAGLLENVTGKVDASSMRIDDYLSDPDFALLLQVSGTTSLTLGLEGNSQRMRDLAGKGTSDDDTAKAVSRAIRAGVRKIKIYFITNWPGEELADVMRIVELGKRLADIRDSFGPAAAGVQVIFSWTPLLIEAQTPLQWFAVTPPDYMLQAALDELREHRIWIKIGSKASPPKLAFFQACQRASRDVGEAIVDVIENYGSASWGGFPKDMREKLDAALVAHGFRNGLDDIFGERFFEDLLGWEMIDTGVARTLMWRVYRDMVEFLEGTSAETYDADIPEGYHGNEWVPRCDQQCSGAACGACDREDLELRREYVQLTDRDLAAEPVRPLDQSTVAQRVRMKVERPEEFRFVSGTSLEYIIRRAAYRARHDIAGRMSRAGRPPFPFLAAESVRLASAGTGYRERSAGVDYAEFGLTRVADEFDIGDYLIKMAVHLHPHLRWGGNYAVLPAAGKLPARPVSLWELEVAGDPAVLARRLRWWDEAETVPVLIRADSFYAGATAQPGDAREHVRDLWLARDGQRTVLRMLLKGRLGPYQAYAALAGKASWLEAARYTARRLEFFSGGGRACEGCGLPVPASLLDVPWSERFCPRCGDEAEGKVIAALTGAGVLQVTAHPVEEPVDSPGFSKTHQYGQPFGTSPDTAPDDDWAGDGYTGEAAPEVLEPVDQPA
jgi:Radical SAM proteins, N-terminal/Radical SAM superfamily